MCRASRAHPTVPLDLHSRQQTLVAAPPPARHRALGPCLPPVLLVLLTAPCQVLLVEVSQMVAEVIIPHKRFLVPETLFVIAPILLLLVVCEMCLPVSLQVGGPAEGSITAWMGARVSLPL